MKPPEEHQPVDQQDYWVSRMIDTLARERHLHTVIYDIDISVWREIQVKTAGLLSEHLNEFSNILDAGCGYGATLDALLNHNVQFRRYLGVDISPELISIAKLRRPDYNYLVGDIRRLPFNNHAFDVATCRSIKAMICWNLGERYWNDILRELRRVSRKVVVFDYDDSPVEIHA